MSYNQPYNGQYQDGRMGGRSGPPRTQDQRFQAPPTARPVGYQGFAQPAYAPAPIGMAQAQQMPMPIAPTVAGAMPVFPPHPDTKPRTSYQPQMMSNPYQQRVNIQELVQVPTELAAFASDPQFQTILLKVKEQTGINYVALNRTSNNDVESIQIDAPSRESAQLARGLIETHFKLQSKLKNAEMRLQKVQTDLFSAQGEIASGMMIEFTIDPELVGLALGKKGARIKQIEQETKVHSINVTGETGRIMVTGPDSSSVQRARELLELQEECIPLESHQIDWLSNKFNQHMLNDIKTMSDLIVTRVNKEKFTLDIVGTVAAVRSARFMLPTQMEYVDKQIEIEGNERQAREKLYEVRKQYGIKSYNRDGGEGGGNGGSHRDNRDFNRDRENRPRTSGGNTGNGSSRTQGQDSLVTAGAGGRAQTAGASSGNTTGRTVKSTPQDVAEAAARAMKKPVTPVTSKSTAAASSTPAAGSTPQTADRGSARKRGEKNEKPADASPVPMLKQVTQQAPVEGGRLTRPAKKTDSGAAKTPVKGGVDELTTGVANLKVTPSNQKSSAAPESDTAPASGNRRRGNKSSAAGATTPAAAEAPAPAPVSRVVEYEEAPLPKRTNNRNKKAAEETAPAPAVTAAPVAAAASAEKDAAAEPSSSARRRQQGNNRGKKESAEGSAPAAAAAAAAAEMAVAPAQEKKPSKPRGKGAASSGNAGAAPADASA